MEFAPSMFNRIVRDDKTILYNSYRGTNSVRYVTAANEERVLQYLASGTTWVRPEGDDVFQSLVDIGYLVPVSVDEKALRDVLQFKICGDGKLRIIIHTTKQCNFRCKYCSLDFTNVPMSRIVQDAVVRFIHLNITRFTAVEVNWFGGEPLLEMGAIEYISKHVMKICRKHMKPFVAIVTTNGYLLSPDVVARLVECKVIHIAVTIDGLPERHDKQRYLAGGGPSFEKIIGNLLWIKEHVATQTLTVSIRNNLTVDAFCEFTEFYSYMDKLFGDDPRFSLFVRPVRDWGGASIRNMEDVLFENSTGLKIGDMYKFLKTFQGGLRFHSNFSDLEPGGLTCSVKYLNKIVIGAEGAVSKCDDSTSIETYGQLLPNGVMELNDDLNAKWMYRHVTEPKCDDCFLSCVCFFEECPKGRIYAGGKSECTVDMHEIDQLIAWTAHAHNVTAI